MFAIGIFGLNLNDPAVTFFNISLFQNYYSPIFEPINITQVPLVQCSADHFAFNQDILTMFNKFNLTYALCPPLGYSFEVGGRLTSDVYRQFSVNIQKCNSTLTPNCASDALISSIGTFTLTVPVVNTIVNAND